MTERTTPTTTAARLLAALLLSLGCDIHIDVTDSGDEAGEEGGEEEGGEEEGGEEEGGEEEGGEEEGGEDEGGEDEGGTTGGDDTTSGGSDTEGESDTAALGEACNTYEQDCAAGLRCTGWANDGGTLFNAARCTNIVDDAGQAGDACQVEGGGVSGVGTCGLGTQCLYPDPKTNVGVCHQLCSGSEDNPICNDPSDVCVAYAGDLPACVSVCDPFAQDCGDGRGCYAFLDENTFICAADVSGNAGAEGDECDFGNMCDPGLTCRDGCRPFCDAEGEACPAGEACNVLFPEIPGFEQIGTCM